MGNKICCEETRTQGSFENSDPHITKRHISVQPPKKVEEKPNNPMSHKPLPTIHQQKPALKEQTVIPETVYNVDYVLTTKKFFNQEEAHQTHRHVKQYGNDVYVGSLDKLELKPDGFGRMYKPDRSLYIGHFRQGKAQGKGAYIFADGSHYYGDFDHNCASSSNGQFVSQAIHYKGSFKNNTFDGNGIEQGKNYLFQGTFSQGARSSGTLTWNNNGINVYKGKFNQQNKFHGKGTLKETEGTYEGDFVNGEKEGYGVYTFKSGGRYEGTYLNGQREGYGTIYHANGSKAYEGGMKHGLPHGKGKVTKDGKQAETIWDQGIDISKLPPK